MKNIRRFRILGELITLDFNKKTLQLYGRKPIDFETLDLIVKEYKNINRIHKPIALLLYTDYKNGKINNYRECEVF